MKSGNRPNREKRGYRLFDALHPGIRHTRTKKTTQKQRVLLGKHTFKNRPSLL